MCVGHLGARQNAHMHALKAAFVPIYRSQIFGKALDQTVECAGAVTHTNVDKFVLWVHPDRMNKAAVNDAFQAMLMGGLPDVISPHKVRTEQLFKRSVISICAHVHNHIRALQHAHHVLKARQIPFRVGLAVIKRADIIDDIRRHKRIARLRQWLAQILSETASGSGKATFFFSFMAQVFLLSLATDVAIRSIAWSRTTIKAAVEIQKNGDSS